jgi:uncharacterized protein YaaQ
VVWNQSTGGFAHVPILARRLNPRRREIAIHHPRALMAPGRRHATMKLIFAIVQDEDTDALTEALIEAGYRFTKISTTGSFLRTGNTSLMIGVEDAGTAGVLDILRKTCRRRTQIAVPYSPALEPGLLYMPENFEVEVGGAVVFVANVARFERI